MPVENLKHGVNIIESDTAFEPVKLAADVVIGLAGTAPAAVVETYPIDTPVLINKLTDAVGIGDTGTLKDALDAIYAQADVKVVLVRVTEGVDSAATITNLVGGVNSTSGAYEGIHAFRAAETAVKEKPSIIIAPGFSDDATLAVAMDTVAEKLDAIAFIDGPNTTDDDAITLQGTLAAKERSMIIDPNVINGDTSYPPTAYFAGVYAKTQKETGFWASPSNKAIASITGLSRPVDYKPGDDTCRAATLNNNYISTIIQYQGYRTWGNRLTNGDFLAVRRSKDVINASIQQSYHEAVDKGITKGLVDYILAKGNAFFRNLVAQGAILGGEMILNTTLSTPDQISAGKIYFDFKFTPVYPAESITFTAAVTNEYVEEIY